jgi:hypothetical protein
MSLRCMVGIHDGNYSYDTAGNCAQSVYCSRCGKTLQRTLHAWGDKQYEKDGKCVMVKYCKRCNDKAGATETVHQYSTWSEPSAACVETKTCQRCGDTETRNSHTWSPWQPAYPNDLCTLERVCLRCKKTQMNLSHEFNQYRYVQNGSCMATKVCSKCGLEDIPLFSFSAKQEELHDWGNWFANPMQRGQLIRICRRCNGKETQGLG